MKEMREEHKRSLLKAVSWRAIATSTTMFLVYVFSGKLELATGIGVGDVVLKMMFYYVHERSWNRSNFGRSIVTTIKSAMRRAPVTAPPSDTVSSIVEKMINRDIGSVIVAEDDTLQGLITEKDVLEKVLAASKDPTKICAKDIMSSPLITVEHNKALTDVLKLMHYKKIRRLAVTQNQKIIGIITQRRALEALVK